MQRQRIDRSRSARGAWIVLAAVAVAACQNGGETASESPEAASEGAPMAQEGTPDAPHSTAAEAMEVGFACADGKTFQVAFLGKDEVRITIEGETHTLARTAGHTGLLFSDGNIVYFGQGREANVEIDGRPAYTDCKAQGHP
jgi:membrane-bound inhibitor of C-type lysozyme